MERIAAHRLLYAKLVTAGAGLPAGSEIEEALASIPREQFVGAPPWQIFTPIGYVEAPSDDPALLYQNVLVSLGTSQPINNGQPSLHATCLAALGVRKGEHVVHVGAGLGYYTAVLAKLVGETGRVDAYEIEPVLAQRAIANLAAYTNVAVHGRSGAEGSLPGCDVVYVNAGATEPLGAWLDALRLNGRLLFPMTGYKGLGGMLLITKLEMRLAARFISPTQFIDCVGARVGATERKLAEAFRAGRSGEVKSLHRGDAPDESCWCSGDGWWLSTRK
jgi:protein-L-isoaspartate(D-aspartate) O-methyltransferase